MQIPVIVTQYYIYTDLLVEFYKEGDFVCDPDFKTETRHVEPLVITFVVFGYFFNIFTGLLLLFLFIYVGCCNIGAAIL